MSDTPPNPCRSCGTALQHCLEMRDDTGTYCCVPCANQVSLHTLLAETEQERRARHLSPGVHAGSALGVGGAFLKVLDAIPPTEIQYAVRNRYTGEVYPQVSREIAQRIAGDQEQGSLQAVSRTLPAWEVLR